MIDFKKCGIYSAPKLVEKGDIRNLLRFSSVQLGTKAVYTGSYDIITLMKGLDLAEAYFSEYGLPLLEKFGPLAGRAAAGMAGPGSECFGLDDEVSRDHDWGPGFCIWLSDSDYDAFGVDLQEAYSRLPQTFRGFGPRRASPGEEHRTGVCRISDFYKLYTGCGGGPETEAEWLRVPENSLAVCTNGRVYRDPLGDFSIIRSRLLGHYPRPLLLRKTAEYAFLAGQSGQYNIWRADERGERFAREWAVMRFCLDSLRLLFLLNRKFAPFDKWILRGARELPVRGAEFAGYVDKMIERKDDRDTAEAMAALLIEELVNQRISTSESPYLIDHCSSIRESVNG